MTSERTFAALCCAGLLVLSGASCGKTTTPSGGTGGGPGTGGGFPGTGGESQSAGATGAGGATSLGGATSAGGTRASGGTTSAGGAGTGGTKGSGGVAGGGSGGVGTGGITGTGGTTTIRDAAPTDSAPPDGASDLAIQRDVAADAPSSPDTGTSPGGDGGCVPNYACKPTSPNTGDMYADCVARINQFRACVCLPPLPRWTAGEACADQESKYDSEQNSPHAGFIAGICTSGNAQDECPDWSGSTPAKVISGCLQMMFDEGPPPAGTCTGQCYTDHGHYINMTGTKYKSGVACGFYTTPSGSIWAAQNFQ